VNPFLPISLNRHGVSFRFRKLTFIQADTPDGRYLSANPALAQVADDPPFDRNTLVRRLPGNQALVERLLESFLNGLPAAAAQLETAVRSGRLKDAAAQAHALCGAAANLSASRLQQVAGDLELTCLDGDQLLAAADVNRMRGEIERCRRFAMSAAAVSEGCIEHYSRGETQPGDDAD